MTERRGRLICHAPSGAASVPVTRTLGIRGRSLVGGPRATYRCRCCTLDRETVIDPVGATVTMLLTITCELEIARARRSSSGARERRSRSAAADLAEQRRRRPGTPRAVPRETGRDAADEGTQGEGGASDATPSAPDGGVNASAAPVDLGAGARRRTALDVKRSRRRSCGIWDCRFVRKIAPRRIARPSSWNDLTHLFDEVRSWSREAVGARTSGDAPLASSTSAPCLGRRGDRPSDAQPQIRYREKGAALGSGRQR